MFLFMKKFLKYLFIFALRKKYWIFPMLFVFILCGTIIILDQEEKIIPFIYKIF